MNTTTLLLRAALHNVASDIRDAPVVDCEPTDVVVAALENVDWSYFDSLSDEDLCELAGHDFDSSSCGTVCYICGAERSRSNGGIQ